MQATTRPRSSARLLAGALLMIVFVRAAHGFVPIDPVTDVQTNVRWSAAPHASTGGKGLYDGISVAIEPGLAEALILASVGSVTAEDVADVERSIVAAFAGWESPVLAFDIVFDGPVVRDEVQGREIDVFVVPGTDPAFTTTGALAGVTFFEFVDEPSRLLTNGTTLAGNAFRGADIFLNKTTIAGFSALFATHADKLAAIQRLLMHEIGHALGLGHPNQFPGSNLDTDHDPLNPMPIDPAAPFAGLILSPAVDPDTIMSNLPATLPGALTIHALRNDERGGRDVLYPALSTTACPPIPHNSCHRAGRTSFLMFAGSSAKKHSARFRWSKGDVFTLADLGDPRTTRRLGLCVYSGSPAQRLSELVVPPSSTRWSTDRRSTLYTYFDRDRVADGVSRIVLQPGSSTKSRVSFDARGAGLALPALGDIPLPITVQVVNQESPWCVEQVFDADDVIENDVKQLRLHARP